MWKTRWHPLRGPTTSPYCATAHYARWADALLKRRHLNTMQSRLEGLRQTIAQRDPTPTGIDIPRIAALNRLIKRVERLSTKTVATLHMVNQCILETMG